MGLFSDIGKTLNQSIIQLTNKPNTPAMYYVGCSEKYTYWSYDVIRALKFNMGFDAEETLKFLQSYRGYKKSKIMNINTFIDKQIPQIYHKPIDRKTGSKKSDKLKKSLKKK